MANYLKYQELFDYLSAASLPSTPEPTIVFGRKDPRIAEALGDLIVPHLVQIAVITGSIGKDSGNIQDLGYRSEAQYIYAQLKNDAHKREYKIPTVLIEETATNGGENARMSLALINEAGIEYRSLTAVAHATSARRLAETLKFEAARSGSSISCVYVKPSCYNFDPSSPVDQTEAVAELLRLANWPEKGWLSPQADLPPNLIDFARNAA